MRNLLCLVLLVPVLALAAGNDALPFATVAPKSGTINATPSSAPTPAHKGQLSVPPKVLVGTLDTIGGTTYDWQTNGPRLREFVNSPKYGVHALWMYSASTATTFSDRNMRYNFYDYNNHTWNWTDPDYMQAGVNVFSKRAGYGSLDAETSGAAVVSCHDTANAMFYPCIARDAGPGYGIFDYAQAVAGDSGNWPAMAVGGNNDVHELAILQATYAMSYRHIKADSWPHLSTQEAMPNPGWITYNLAASKVSSKVAAVWVTNTGVGTGLEPAHVDFTTDAGMTWSGDSVLALPVAYGDGSDTITSCMTVSLFPWYDQQDRFHLVANLEPVLPNDSLYIVPSQIWHYCPDNNPQWNRIHIATASNFASGASVGYNAAFACRPTIGQDGHGDLFVSWEQFDSLNVEPTTSYLRANIFAARSNDNGETWGAPVQLTDSGSTYSMRFPCVIDRAVDDTMMWVLYEEDSLAGFVVEGQGPASRNPIVIQKVPISMLPKAGVAEQRPATLVRLDVAAKPNPFGGRTSISYSVPRSGEVSLVVYDAAGRPVRNLASGRREPGRYTATWDAHDAAAGVYFYTLKSGKASITRKLILTR